jgi:hypothetical protein
MIKVADVPRDPSTPRPCGYLISPGLLKRCSLYRRNENEAPEKCFDSSAHLDLPPSTRQECPNHTGKRSPLRFTEEQIRTYPLFGVARETLPTVRWDHEGGSQQGSLEPEEDEEG